MITIEPFRIDGELDDVGDGDADVAY